MQKSNLEFAPPGTKNIDAISRDGHRYSVKSTSSNLTGVFYGFAQKKPLTFVKGLELV